MAAEVTSIFLLFVVLGFAVLRHWGLPEAIAAIPAAAIVVASEMDSNESRAIGGWPGISEVPGLNDITSKNRQKNYSTLLIVMTPHVVRSPRVSDHTNMVHIERNFQTR